MKASLKVMKLAMRAPFSFKMLSAFFASGEPTKKDNY